MKNKRGRFDAVLVFHEFLLEFARCLPLSELARCLVEMAEAYLTDYLKATYHEVPGKCGQDTKLP